MQAFSPRARASTNCTRAPVRPLCGRRRELTATTTKLVEVRVGISLLTLVPGVVGGSETYARELTRALARVGELDYEAFVPSIAPDAADGLPTRVVQEYRAGSGTAQRIAAMSSAWVAPGRLRR